MRSQTAGSTMASIGRNFVLGMATLGLNAVGISGVCHAQQRAVNFNGIGGIGSTVSVASLRIPEKAWQHFSKATSLIHRNRLAEADLETQKAIAIAPDFAAAHLLRANVQVREHSFLAATASVAEARRTSPDLQWSGVVLAGALNGLRRYQEARAALEALTGDEARSWQASYERARSAIGLHDTSEALRWSEAALAGAPADFTDALVVRANSLTLACRWSEAASQLVTYLQTEGSSLRRTEVLTALERDKNLARTDESRPITSRE